MFLTHRFYWSGAAIACLLAAGYCWPPLFAAGKMALWLWAALTAAEAMLLYHRRGMHAARLLPERFSNGDQNDVRLRLESSYPFATRLTVVDEAPFVFQRRDIGYRLSLPARQGKTLVYQLRPTERGVYGFGHVRVFASTRLSLVQRRYTEGRPQDVKVYPSFLRLRQYELMAISDNLTETGAKRIRRVGNHTEFEHIQDYTPGDDFRTINWKASARRHQLMTNVYQDERSQRIYSLVDKGRVMQQAFAGMTLLDYSINAALALSFVAMRKQDNAGLMTFNEQFQTFVPAGRRSGHMQTLLEALYGQQTTFGETDFSALCTAVSRHVTRRSLLVLYTSFASLSAMQRQLPYLRQLSRRHCLLVVFFEDDDLHAFASDGNVPGQHAGSARRTTELYYQRVIAEKFEFEKRLIVATLKQHGIYALLSTPARLSVNVINKYLELKSRNVI